MKYFRIRLLSFLLYCSFKTYFCSLYSLLDTAFIHQTFHPLRVFEVLFLFEKLFQSFSGIKKIRLYVRSKNI